MYLRILGIFLVLVVLDVSARSIVYDDVDVVGSLRREVRQPITVSSEVEDLVKTTIQPKRIKNASGKSNEGGYYRTYGDGLSGEKGYMSKTFGKGEQGYKTLDTFHKQGGDKYGFEEHLDFDPKRKEKYESSDKHNISDEEGDTDGDNGRDDYRYYRGHYTAEGPESESHEHSYGGPSSNYSMVDGDGGSYETHSSYSRHNGEGEGSYDGYGSSED